MKTKFATIIALFLITASPLVGEDAVVRLINRTSVTAPSIELGEIAHIETEDPALFSALKNLEIDQAPEIGRKKMISAYRLRGILENAGFENVEVLGLQSMAKTEEMEIPFSEIERKIQAYANEQISPDMEIEIEFPSLKEIWKAPLAEKVDFEVSHRGNLGGRTHFKVEALVEGKLLSQFYMPCQVKVLRDSVVLVRPITKGQEIAHDDFEIRKAEISNTTGMELASGEQVIGMVAKRNLPIGTLIKSTHFEKPIAIERGSLSRLLIVNGTIKMQLTGAKALEDGKEGETIRFKNPVSNGEVIRAKVIGPGRALLKLR